MGKPVFEQDQIKRAVELGLGASGPDEIELVPVDDETEEVAEAIDAALRSRP